MKKIVRRQKLTHYAAASIGGFMGGYTIINHIDIFCNAQTGNLLELVLGLCRGDFRFIGFMALSFLIYCCGNVFYVLVRRRATLSMKIVSLICTSAAVIIVGAFPFIANDYVACYPLIFVAPIQWNAFKIAGGHSSSTIFSSNNVRQASILTTNFFLTRDRQTGAGARFYWLTLLSFNTGAAFAFLTGIRLGVTSIWFCFVPILLTCISYYRYKSEKLRVAAIVHDSKNPK